MIAVSHPFRGGAKDRSINVEIKPPSRVLGFVDVLWELPFGWVLNARQNLREVKVSICW